MLGRELEKGWRWADGANLEAIRWEREADDGGKDD